MFQRDGVGLSTGKGDGRLKVEVEMAEATD